MKVGAKTTYDANKLDEIVANVVLSKGSFGQVADLSYIPRDTFYGWLRRGEDDRNNGLETELAQFASKLRHSQAKIVIDFCYEALREEKKAKFIMWWLSKICREDFGQEGMEIKELKDLFKIILPLLGKGAVEQYVKDQA